VISFVGAGPGGADLITIRGAERIAAADVVVWAGSLVAPALIERRRPDAVVHDSSGMTFEEVTAVFAAHPDAAIVRLHSGDPTVYSALAEQVDWCRRHGRPYEIVPGVSSVSATAAAAGVELTVPGVAQSVVLTRLARRTAASVPAGESVATLARHGATMALYLSAGDPEALQRALLGEDSAYTPDTPVVLGYRVSWPDELLRRSRLGRLAEDLAELGATTSVMILLGDALGDADAPPVRSHVYSAGFGHAFRPAQRTPP
jgi:precorrin-4/cobalt-precorrin-4 C11-methyltransferase